MRDITQPLNLCYEPNENEWNEMYINKKKTATNATGADEWWIAHTQYGYILRDRRKKRKISHIRRWTGYRLCQLIIITEIRFFFFLFFFVVFCFLSLSSDPKCDNGRKLNSSRLRPYARNAKKKCILTSNKRRSHISELQWNEKREKLW